MISKYIIADKDGLPYYTFMDHLNDILTEISKKKLRFKPFTLVLGQLQVNYIKNLSYSYGEKAFNSLNDFENWLKAVYPKIVVAVCDEDNTLRYE
jgi:hypothetical protein